MWLSEIVGITGLIYANCISMAIRFTTSLYYGIRLEKEPRVAFKNFVGEINRVEIGFIIEMVKKVVNKRRQKSE